MQVSVKIMDIDIDMMSNDIFIQKMNEYLTDDSLDVILFASTQMLNRAVEEPEYRQMLDEARLLLPGEEALLTTHHVDALEAGGMVVSCRSLGMMLENMIKEDRTLYIIAESQEEVAKLEDYCKAMQPELRVVGSFAYDSAEGVEDAAIVNEINSHTPDMLLLNLSIGVQEEWIFSHLPLLNAKLCIGIGSVADLILAQQKETPDWVKKLHLEGVFRSVVKEQTVKKDVKARIFRKKIVQYNNQAEKTTYVHDISKKE